MYDSSLSSPKHLWEKKYTVEEQKNRFENVSMLSGFVLSRRLKDKTYFITLKKQKSKDLRLIRSIRGME